MYLHSPVTYQMTKVHDCVAPIDGLHFETLIILFLKKNFLETHNTGIQVVDFSELFPFLFKSLKYTISLILSGLSPNV